MKLVFQRRVRARIREPIAVKAAIAARAGACLMLAAVLSSCGSGERLCEWTDPEGDARPYSNVPDYPMPDIVSVTANSGHGMLVLKARLKNGVMKAKAGYSRDNTVNGDSIVEYFIDCDNNEATGGSPFWHNEADRPLNGYDCEVSISTGFRYRDKKTGSEQKCLGGIVLDFRESDILQIIAGYLMSNKGERAQKVAPTLDKAKDGYKDFNELTAIKDDSITIWVPYRLLDVSSGRTIRLCYKECAEGGASGKGISEDKFLVLN